ncbi:MAG: mannosyltransferase family protein [Candidatus Daviesbacteria bacterium]|nr:mannosyltransferase family protein [Candidatus Daviesbacteria bacterium]
MLVFLHNLLYKLPQIFYPVTVFVAWRSLILIFQLFVQPVYYGVNKDSYSIYQRVFLSWTTYWDSGHYIGIALKGYQYPQQAFFPLWSLLIKITSLSGVSIYAVVYFLTFILGLTTFILFYILASRLIGQTKAKYALIFFASFPSTMFLHAGYTEGLFLTLTLLSFLLLEKRLYFLGSLVGGLIILTRLAGVGVAVAYLTINKSLGQKLRYFILCLLGLGLYMIYLQIAFGDAFYFAKAQQAWCQISNRCSFTFPLLPLLNYLGLLLLGVAKVGLTYDFIDWISVVLFLFLLVFVYRQLSFSYFVYSLTALLLPLFSGSTAGMVRYVLVAFPIFFIVPSLIKNKILMWVVLFLLFLLQLRFVAFFTSRLWVA